MNATTIRYRTPFLLRLLAVTVLLAFSVCQIPVGAIGNLTSSDTEPDAYVPQPGGLSAAVTAEATVVGEATDKREESVKHFVMSDGSYRAVQYALPVHYQQDDEWVEYNNSLTEVNSTEAGNPDFVNATSDIAVRLSKKSNGHKWVRLEKDGYKLSWYFTGAQKVTGTVETATDDGDVTTLETVTSTVIYPGIYAGVDLRERVRPDGVKEDLLLQNANAPTAYEAVYDIDKLTAVQVDDRTIELRDTDGTVIYTLSAPYMVDADGAISTALTLRITSTHNKTITTLLTVDEAWVKDPARVFPITVDPGVTTGQQSTDSTYVQTAYTSSLMPTETFGYTNCPNEGFVYVGKTIEEGSMRAYLKLNTLPTLRETDTIVRANLTMYAWLSLGEMTVSVHQVNSDWSPSTVSWNSNVAYDAAIRDTQKFYLSDLSYPEEERYRTWDITLIANSWYATANGNKGLMLKSDLENEEDVSTHVQFYSCAHDVVAGRPVVEIQYRSHIGLENYWSYTGVAAGRSGSAQVNLFNGNLVATHPAVQSADGNYLPLSIGLVYNSAYADTRVAYSALGNGWRTNFHQSVHDLDVDSDGTVDYYVYTDGDGTEHTFPYDTETMRDEDGLGYTLVVQSTGETRFIITDKAHSEMRFNADGRLTKICDANNNAITVYYTTIGDSSRIEMVTDGPGRMYIFLYSSDAADAVITSFVDPSNRLTNLTYSGNTLTAVNFPDGKQLTLTYDASGRLSTLTGNDGSTTAVTYDNTVLSPVKTLVRRYGTDISEQYTFTYVVGETYVKDVRNRVTVYQFDSFGQTTGVLSEEAGAGRFYEYVDRSANPLSTHKLSLESRVQAPVNNLIQNPRVDYDGVYWTYQYQSAAYGMTWDSARGNTANGSLKVSRTALTENPTYPCAYYVQSLTAQETGNYTFSAFVNTNGVAFAGDGAVVRLERWRDGSHLNAQQIGVTATDANEWKRASVTLPYQEGDSIRVIVGFNGQTTLGTAWFDDLQLEYGETANHYNLLQNNTFTNGTAGWTNNAAGTVTAITDLPDLPEPEGNSLRVEGDRLNLKRTIQTINVSGGQPGDIYSFGAWGKADSGPMYLMSLEWENALCFGVRLDFLYGTTIVGSTRIPFNEFVTGWQMTGGQAIAPSLYTSVRIVLEYNNNINTAYFAQPYVYRERFGQSYTYDDNGNLIATEDLAKQKSTFAYHDDDLYRMLNPTGSAYLYSYNDKGVLQSALTTDGVLYTPTYDEQGNVLSAQTAPMRRVTELENGKVYHLINAHTGTMLYVSSDSGVAQTGNIAAHTAEGKWLLTYDENNNVRLMEQTDGQRYLGVAQEYEDVYSLRVVPANTDPAFSVTAQPDGTFTFRSAITGYAKSLVAESSEDGAQAVLSSDSTSAQQEKWYVFEPVQDDSPKIITTATYMASGTFMQTSTDALGYTTTYEHDIDSGLLLSVTDARDATTSYTYNAYNDRLESVSAGGETVSYQYDAKDRLVGITLANGQQYVLEYDGRNRNTAIKIKSTAGEMTLSTTTYDAYNRVTRQDYGNGAYVTFTYDSLDRTKTKGYNGDTAQVTTYYYNADGMLGAVMDTKANTVTRYLYDLSGRLAAESTYTGSYIHTVNHRDTVSYTYDAKTGQVTNITYDTAIGDQSESYVYGDMGAGQIADAVYTVKQGDTPHLQYTYDELGRLSSVTIVPINKTTTYTYTPGGHGANSTSTQIASETVGGVTTSYTYNQVGNIVEVYKNGVFYESFNYNELGQLTNATYGSGDVYIHEYDANGNVALIGKNDEVYKTYTYGNPVWKDQLTAFNGNTITYDAIGNPTAYYDGAAMTWANGRQMTSYTKGDNAVTFTYDGAGNRLSKTVNGTATTYTYVGGRLYGQQTGANKLVFLYDANGSVYGFTYNGVSYYYHRNIQGDVLGIYDSTGTELVTYSYDAWGLPTGMTDTSTNGIGTINPIRYRGYLYDAELGFYWLTTRFYDPIVGRVISPDTTDIITATPMGMTDKNLYAYCDNNPVIRADHGGDFWHIVVGAVVGAVVGGVAKAVANVIEQKPVTEGLGTAIIAGAASGALASTGVGTVGLIAGNAAISMAANATDQVIANQGFDNFDVGDMLVDGAVGGALGAMGAQSASTNHIARLGVQAAKRTTNALAHKGVAAGLNELKKSFSYFVKSTKNLYKREAITWLWDIANGVAEDIVFD